MFSNRAGTRPSLCGGGTLGMEASLKKLLGIGLGVVAAAALVVTAFAASTVVVTPSNLQGWTGTPPGADTRPGGTVAIISDPHDGGNGALQLKTINDPLAKAQFMHAAPNVPLSSVTELSYSTKLNSAPFLGAAASYQLPICLAPLVAGACPAGSFTTLVYEPYQNGAPVQPVGVWQSWDVDAGLLWSSRTATGPGVGCGTIQGFGGAPFYSVATLGAACPSAVALGFGVNVGSNNANWDVEADFVNFNGTKYDFEMFVPATNKDQCKDGGWQNVTRANGTTFKNQGDCVSYTNNGR
jgi:hypothetical protein